MKSVLTTLLALVVLAVGASTAHAGAMTLNASVQGAGQISAVSGGDYDCDHRGQELETDVGGCDTGFYSAAFSVSITLKAVAPSGWKRSGWEGCDEVDSKGQCVITGPIASRGYKTVKALFEDTAGPVVTWDLKRLNGDDTIDLAWHADEPTTYRCSVFGIKYEDCTSPYHTTILSQGSYRWDIEATDRNGSKTYFSAGFTNVQSKITSAPSGRVNSRSASILFGLASSGDRNDGYQCRLDGGEWAACTSPWNLDNLADGQHTAEVRGHRDGVYEVIPESRTWTVDTVAPKASLADGPAGQVAAKRAAFTLSTDEPGRFECSLDGAAWSACGPTPAYDGLADGGHTFAGRVIDEAGNISTPVERSWSIDTTPSVTTLAGPVEGSTTSARTATFSFVAGDGARFECRLDGAAFAKCTSPWTVKDLADGRHVAQIRSIDDAGNAETPKQVSWTVATPKPADPGAKTQAPPTGQATATATTTATTPASTAPSTRAASTTTTPTVTKPVFSGARKGTAKVDKRGRFTVPGLKITCPTACTVTAKTAGGTGSLKLAAGKTGTVKVTLGKAARKKRGKVKVTVTAGGVTATVAVTLK